jgi:hypothetical protein
MQQQFGAFERGDDDTEFAALNRLLALSSATMAATRA